MYMTIRYHWENMTVNRECDYGRDTVSPHTKASVEDVDYDYECVYTIEDIVEYLLPYIPYCYKPNETEKSNRSIMKQSYRKAIEFLENNGCVDYDMLESDKDFVEFLKKRYESKALEEFEESNDAY